MYKLTKKFRFEAAHRLAQGYVGKCANIHGHSWNGEIEVRTDKIDEMSIAVDFSVLKKFCKIIESTFDHAIILFHGDKEIINLCQKNNWLYTLTKNNPTCEELSQVIYSMACTYFAKEQRQGEAKFWIESVRIEETCTTSCTYHE